MKNIEDKITDITNLATETTLNAKIKKFKNKIASIANLATTTALNIKINENKGKIRNINNSAATTGPPVVDNKISNVSILVIKTDYNTKNIKIENKITTAQHQDKYITAPEFNKSLSENFTARLKQANLANKKK